jgi:hypothetical protein
MPAPDKVLIPYDADIHGRFDTVGKFSDGRQFMAFETGAFPQGYALSDDWLDVKRWLAVIHIFDADGNHLESEARLNRYARDEKLLTDEVFNKLLADYQIDASMYCDIWIRAFHIVIDDIKYEFVYEEYQAGDTIHEQMALSHPDVVFYPPYDNGLYDT